MTSISLFGALVLAFAQKAPSDLIPGERLAAEILRGGRVQISGDYGVRNRIDYAGSVTLEGPAVISAGLSLPSGIWKLPAAEIQSRLPVSARGQVRMVELPFDAIRGGWHSEQGQAGHRSGAVGANSPDQPLVVVQGNTALSVASSLGPGGYLWSRVTRPSGSPTLLKSNLAATGINARAVVFADVDYDVANVAVRKFSSDGTVELGANPFAIRGARGTTDWTRRQRFRLINALELLDQPGEFVLDSDAGRIYFWPLASTDQVLTVSSPRRQGTGNTIFERPLNFTGAKKVVLRNLTFRAGISDAIRLQDCEDVLIENCRFIGMGQNAVVILRSQNVTIRDCTFQDSYRSHVTIGGFGNQDAALRSDGTANPLGPSMLAFKSDGIRFENCRFERSGLLYPASPAVQLVNYPVGVEFENCDFVDTEGPAIRLHGMLHRVRNSRFTRCVRSVTDAGAVGSGRSWIQIGNVIENCTFTDITRREPGGPPENSLADDVAGIYFDDGIGGQSASRNRFINSHLAILSNGGRYNLFDRNVFENTRALRPYFIRSRPSDAPRNFNLYYTEARWLMIGAKSFDDAKLAVGSYRRFQKSGNDLLDLFRSLPAAHWQQATRIDQAIGGRTALDYLLGTWIDEGRILSGDPQDTQTFGFVPGARGEWWVLKNESNLFRWNPADFKPSSNASRAALNRASRAPSTTPKAFYYGFLGEAVR